MKLVGGMSWQLGLVCVLALLLANTCLADWRAHEIEQLNGTAPRIKATAQFQIITQSKEWDKLGQVTYPYMVYMPEQDKLLMLLMWESETHAGIMSSSDGGATWTKPKGISAGRRAAPPIVWNIGLTYLGCGKAVLKDVVDNKYRFSYDYGESWDYSVTAPPCKDGEPFYEDSPFFVDRDRNTGSVTRLWATGKKPGLPGLVRHSDDGGHTWSQARHIPQWGNTGEIILHRANNGNIVAACRVNLPATAGKIDTFSGLGVSVSRDNGQTWSDLNYLYLFGRHMSSMVTLANGDIVLTYVAQEGYVNTVDGYKQFGIEAVVSHDNGLTWDLDHRYLLAVWKGNATRSSGTYWHYAPQRTATVLLPDGSLVTAFGTVSIWGVGLVRWRVNDEELSPDTTIRDAPFDSDARNVFDPKISDYAMAIPDQAE